MIPHILVEKAGELEAAVREKFPALAPLARQCFLNTIETTVTQLEDGSYFVITGDIPAMWLRDIDDDAVLTREFSFVVIAFFNEFHPENTVRFAEHLCLRKKLPQLVKTCVGRNIPTDRLLPQQGIPHTIADSKGLLLCIRQSLHDSGNFLW